MKRSKYYGLRLPERGAREGEANDPADVEDLTYDFGVVDAELERQRSEDARLEKDKAARAEMLRHTGDWENPHGVTAAQAGAYTKAEADALVDGAVAAHAERSDNPHAVTKAQVGLGKVPNVATDDQTPAYTEAAGPSALSSGEKLSAAFAKLAAAVTALLAHLADSVRHLTEAERGAWDGAAEAAHTHANKSLLDAYAQTEADLAAVVGAKHGHTNQSVLDEITAAQLLCDGVPVPHLRRRHGLKGGAAVRGPGVPFPPGRGVYRPPPRLPGGGAEQEPGHVWGNPGVFGRK